MNEELEPEVMHCAELPEDALVLRASIEPGEPAITISIAEELELECMQGLTHWSGTLTLPADITPGTHMLGEVSPSLYIRDRTLATCMNLQSGGVALYATGTVTITSVAGDCVAGTIDAETLEEDGFSSRYSGAFAAEPRK